MRVADCSWGEAECELSKLVCTDSIAIIVFLIIQSGHCTALHQDPEDGRWVSPSPCLLVTVKPANTFSLEAINQLFMQPKYLLLLISCKVLLVDNW